MKRLYLNINHNLFMLLFFFFAQSSIFSLSGVLEDLKLNELFVDNNTDSPVKLRVSYHFYPDFDEEDFTTQTSSTFLFSSDYEVVSPGNGKKYAGINGCPHVTVAPYRGNCLSNAIVLQKIIEIPTEGRVIESIKSSYISSLVPEGIRKIVFYKRTEPNQLSLIIDFDELLKKEVFERNLYEFLMSPEVQEEQIFRYFIEQVTESHSIFSGGKVTRRKKLFQKFQDVHTSGLRIIDSVADNVVIPSPFKVPLILHTFLIERPGSDLLSQSQKSYLEQSIGVLSKTEGWRYFVWVNNADFGGVRETLGDLTEKIEIKNFTSEGFTSLDNISNFLAQGKYNHALSFLKYEVLKKFGGVVRGVDSEIVQNLSCFNQLFSFYAGLGSKISQFVGSEILAACPDHPVIERVLDLARYHYFQKKENVKYLKGLDPSFPDSLYTQAEHYIKYGEAPLTIAFYQNAAPGKDMLFDKSVLSKTSDGCRLSENYVINHTDN